MQPELGCWLGRDRRCSLGPHRAFDGLVHSGERFVKTRGGEFADLNELDHDFLGHLEDGFVADEIGIFLIACFLSGHQFPLVNSVKKPLLLEEGQF